MNTIVKKIIDDYLKSVNDVCNQLIEEINRSENTEIKNKYQFFHYLLKTHKNEFKVNNVVYKLHGKGCFVFLNEKILNWDFGYRSRWCGIDPYKISMTLKINKSQFTDYYDGELLKTECEKAVSDGEMFYKDNQYYYSVPVNETFVPKYPNNYDSLEIEYYDKKWRLLRNKEIDRFLRKSNRIHNKIYEKKDVYILRFYLDNKEIYSIPYDDVCYPESAVKILTDNIIKNVKKNSV